MESRPGLDIAIIGGGIAGLTLAIALHNRGVSFTIYEQAVAFGEIGAGVSFSPNAVRAMECCHHGVTAAFERVCTRNRWESKQRVWFDFHDGSNSQPRPSFTIISSLGQRAVHRADFVTELVKLLPDHVARFNKRLTGIVEGDDGRLLMNFQDGTQATADAVIGCDGIHSRVRQMIFPSSAPSYSHQYAYRGLIPMDRAAEVLGREKSENACMHVSEPQTLCLTA
jgi:salicylate hydroxylase